MASRTPAGGTRPARLTALLAALLAAPCTAPLPFLAQATAGVFQATAGEFQATAGEFQATAGVFQATAALPDIPAGARMRELIEAVNQGGDAALAAFVENRITPAYLGDAGAGELTSFLPRMRDLHGTLTFHSEHRFPARPMPDRMVAILRTAQSQRWLGIMITSSPRHRTASSRSCSAPRPPRSTPSIECRSTRTGGRAGRLSRAAGGPAGALGEHARRARRPGLLRAR